MDQKILKEINSLSTIIDAEDEKRYFIALCYCILSGYESEAVCNLFENDESNNFVFKNGFINILEKSNSVYVIEMYQYNKNDESYYVFYIIDKVFSMLFNSYLAPKYPTTLDMFLDVDRRIKEFEIEVEILTLLNQLIQISIEIL